MAARMNVLVVLAFLAVAIQSAVATNNTVTLWQFQTQEIARTEKLPHQVAVRVSALVALATHGALVVNKAKGFPANQSSVVSYAGHYILSTLYPGQQSGLDVALQKQLADTKDSDPVTSKARQIAVQVGAKVLADRVNDGSQQYVNFKPAPPGGPIGDYQFTPNQTFALYPQLATTRLFVAQSNKQETTQLKRFTNLPNNSEYQVQLAQTKLLGDANSTTRTQDQSDIAQFWAGGAGTKTVSGYWGQIAADSLPASTTSSLGKTARFWALFYTTLYDNNIKVWQIKYTQKFWRPITAIRQGDGTNPTDATWSPYLPTPAHPEYPSGHQATSGAAYGVLRRYLGGDSIDVTVRTDYPTPAAPLADRTYTSLLAIADEIGNSRIYAGLHLHKSNKDAVALGDLTARYATANFDRKYGTAAAFI